MTNPTLEQRAREWLDRLCASQPAEIDIEEGDELIPLDTAIRAMLTFSHTGVEQAIEACAKVARGYADRNGMTSDLCERIAADIESLRATLPAQSPDDIAYAGAVPSPVNVEGLVEALQVGECFLNKCFSAWAAGEPSHRVQDMLDAADEFRVKLNDPDVALARYMAPSLSPDGER